MTTRETFFLEKVDKHVQFWIDRITALKTNQQLPTGKEHTENPISPRGVQYTLIREHVYYINACYSRGYKLKDIKKIFEEELLYYLFSYHQSPAYQPWDFSDCEMYLEAVWIMDWAILFDLSPNNLRKIAEIIGQVHQDAFFDALIGYQQKDTPTLYPDAYQPLVNLLNNHKNLDSESKTALSIQFLRSYYYELLYQVWWYNTHVELEKRFFGYWAWSMASVVKLTQIDDIQFADNMFYPRDLVHEKFYRTWLDSEEGEADRLEHLLDLRLAEAKAETKDSLDNIHQKLDEVMEDIEGKLENAITENPDLVNQLTEVDFIDQLLLMLSNFARQAASDEVSKKVKEELEQLQTNIEEENIEIDQEFVQALQEAMGDMDPKQLQAEQKQQLKKLADDLDEIRLNQTISPEEKANALQNYALEAGFINESDVQSSSINWEEEQEKLNEQFLDDMKERRKGKKMIDFTFDDLWNEE